MGQQGCSNKRERNTMDKRKELKALLVLEGITQWKLAEHLGITESKFSRMVRTVSEEEFEKYKEAIQEIKKE
jgi:DNA-binding transcriptional regulator LsrR (DeoR family)